MTYIKEYLWRYVECDVVKLIDSSVHNSVHSSIWNSVSISVYNPVCISVYGLARNPVVHKLKSYAFKR